MQKTVAVNEAGRRIGEDHPDAKLTDAEVEMMRELHEQHRWGWKRLAKTFEVSTNSAKKICLYKTRAQTAARFKRVHLTDSE